MTEQIAKRDNQGKPELAYWMMFPKSAEALSDVMMYGASKYGKYNYQLGGKPDEEYLNSFTRHYTAMMKYYITGDDADLYDDESGCLHLGHMFFNLFMLLDYNYKHKPIKRKE